MKRSILLIIVICVIVIGTGIALGCVASHRLENHSQALNEECLTSLNSGLKAFVIASEKDFDDSKWRLDAIGLNDIERIDPVYTEDICAGFTNTRDGTKQETGCFRAHKEAWRRCSEQSAERCLVLERDWTYGDQDPEDVKRELETLPTDSDYFQIGSCYERECMHAYTIAKKTADRLYRVRECKIKPPPVDTFLEDMCKENILKCDKYDKPNMPNCFGEGLIQQNRDTMTGMSKGISELHNPPG